MSDLVRRPGTWVESRRAVSTFVLPRQTRLALANADAQALEAATRNGHLGELATQAVRNVHRFAREVQGMTTDSMYVATAADAYYVELLEGQAQELRRFRRGF